MRSPEELLRDLMEGVEAVKPNRRVIIISPQKLREAIIRLLNEYGREGVLFSTLVGVDKPQNRVIELTYFINVIPIGGVVALRVNVNREAPSAPSISDLLPGAMAGELEAYDLLGVVFEGNRGLRRGFLAPPDMVAKGVHALRKDAKW